MFFWETTNDIKFKSKVATEEIFMVFYASFFFPKKLQNFAEGIIWTCIATLVTFATSGSSAASFRFFCKMSNYMKEEKICPFSVLKELNINMG